MGRAKCERHAAVDAMTLRGVTDDERALLTQVRLFGSDGYPLVKFRRSRGWTWRFRTVTGPPTVFKTKHAAVASFEAFMDVLEDAVAGRV